MIDEYYETPPPRPQGGGRKWPSLADRFEQNIRRQKGGCWLWDGCILPNGYGVIGFRGNTLLAHRVAYELEYGCIPPGLCICHHCDNPPCVNPHHLFAGTHSDNENDKYAKGRGRRGSRHPNAKLTEAQVLAIRAERPTGLSLSALASRYRVSKKLILVILQRKSWVHI